MADHALLSASGASRWINCPPSARLEEQFENTSSKYAGEGTLAHNLAEIILKDHFGKLDGQEYSNLFEEITQNKLFSDNMPGYVGVYTGYVIEQTRKAQAKKTGAELLIEEKVDLSNYINEGFGTCDSNIIADGTLEIVDLKYGQGVKVEAKENNQLMIYALGALDLYDLSYDIKRVKLTIVQPRLNHIDSWAISVTKLKQWAKKVLTPAAELAYDGKGLQKSGGHCRWCRAKAKCATLAADNVKIAKHDFKDPHLLTEDQMIEVFEKIPLLTQWAEAVKEYMTKEALEGKEIKGYKIVEDQSKRKIDDEIGATKVLLSAGYGQPQVENSKLKGISELEKLLGKENFNNLLGQFIVKPPGKPTLVSIEDKRPAMGAKSDFI